MNDRKILEEAVQSENIAEAMNECLWVGDKKHNTIYVNPTFEKTSEYTLDEAVKMYCTDFFDDEGKKIIEDHHKLRVHGVSSQYEATMVSKSGKRIPLLISGAPTKSGGTIGVFTNLTKLKKLAEKERLSNQIIRNSMEAIVVLDKNRKIQLWNTSAQKLFGYKEQEIINKSVDFIIPKEEEDTNKRLITEVEKNKVIRNYETTRLSKEGESIPVSVSVSKVTDEKDKFIGYLVTYRDISTQKRTSTELQKRFETIQDAYKELGFQRRQMDYIAEITESAISNSDLNSLLNLIISAIVLLSKADAAVLRLYNKKTKFLELAASLGVDEKWQSKSRIEFKNSIAEEACELKRPLLVDNVDSSELHKSKALAKTHKFKTLISIPLALESEYIGSLNIYSKNPEQFRLIETDFLQKFGQQCAMSIYTKLQKQR
ncbi:MEKHLA domain-containing protein [Candidatus Gracilibacteria bacterium]|nr:MEKHLA domain-containing protein [Candidatus Gracilibacteria bacterium]